MAKNSILQNENENTINEQEIELAILHLVEIAEKAHNEELYGLEEAMKSGFIDEFEVAKYRNFKKGEVEGLHIAIDTLNYIIHHNQ